MNPTGHSAVPGGLSQQTLHQLSALLNNQPGMMSHLAQLGLTTAGNLPNGVAVSQQQQQQQQQQQIPMTQNVIATSTAQLNSLTALPQMNGGAMGLLTAAVANSAPGGLNWPLHHPLIQIFSQVPYFDLPAYRNVNVDVQPSQETTGFDLPLSDVTTLRFYFNLGVAMSRALLANQNYQQQLMSSNATTQNGLTAAQLASLTQAAQTPGLGAQQQLASINILPQTAAQLAGGGSLDLQQLGSLMTPSSQAAILRQAQAQVQAAVAQQQQQQHAAQQQAQAVAAAQAQAQAQQQQQQLQAQMLASRAAAAQQQHNAAVEQQMNQSHADLIAQTQQSLGGTPAAAAASQLVNRHSLLSGSQPSSMAPPTSQPQQKTSNAGLSSGIADQQALLLHQALLASAMANSQAKSNHTDLRMQHVLGHPQMPNSFGRGPHEVLRPVAVGMGSGDAAVSPRPPPLDPSPPRPPHETAAATAAVALAVHQRLQQQQAAVSSAASLSAPSSVIGSARPNSARDAQLVRPSTGNSVQGSAPATPANTTEDGSGVTSLFQVSEQHFTEAFTKGKKSPPNPIGIARHGAEDAAAVKAASPSSNKDASQGGEDGKPALAPILMMSYLNNCMSQLKSTLNSSGIAMDPNGRPVDFSSRPVDPIFQQARQQLDAARDVSASPSKIRPSNSSSGSPIAVTTARSASATVTPVLGINRPSSESAKTMICVDSDDEDSPSKRLRIATDEE